MCYLEGHDSMMWMQPILEERIFMFWWNEKKIVILPTNKIGVESKTSKVEGKSFLSIFNSKQEFITDSKEMRICYAFIMKGEKPHEVNILKELRSILKEFKEITHEELPNGLLTIRNI